MDTNVGLSLRLGLTVTTQLKKVLDQSHCFNWVQNPVLQSRWSVVLLFKLLWREQAPGCTANWNWTGVCDMGTCNPCQSDICPSVHWYLMMTVCSLSIFLAQPANIILRQAIVCSTKYQAGSSYVPRNLGASTPQSATIIEGCKMIFTMARQLVTAGPVTDAINVLAWHLSKT